LSSLDTLLHNARISFAKQCSTSSNCLVQYLSQLMSYAGFLMHFLLFVLHFVSFMCISFMSLFLCCYVLFAVCVNGPLWTDFQINGMEWNGSR